MEIIQIVLVEKDKQELLRSYQTMGMIALEQGGNKDKFLIQSTTVSLHDATTKFQHYDAITELWSNVPSGAALANKKLHVRYQVESNLNQNNNGTTPTIQNRSNTHPAAAAAAATVPSNLSSNNNNNLDHLTADQLRMEMLNVRRKYDDLIAFSVNLTAERDMLSNTLEVTRRDYKQLLQQQQQQPPPRAGSGATKLTHTRTTSPVRFVMTSILWLGMILTLCALAVGCGIYLEQQQQEESFPIPTALQPIIQHLARIIGPLLVPTNTAMHPSATVSTTDEL